MGYFESECCNTMDMEGECSFIRPVTPNLLLATKWLTFYKSLYQHTFAFHVISLSFLPKRAFSETTDYYRIPHTPTTCVFTFPSHSLTIRLLKFKCFIIIFSPLCFTYITYRKKKLVSQSHVCVD